VKSVRNYVLAHPVYRKTLLSRLSFDDTFSVPWLWQHLISLYFCHLIS